MKYRIRYFSDGGYEYHAFKTTPPAHTLKLGWKTVNELPKEIIEADKIYLNKPSEIEALKIRITELEASR